MSYYPPPPSYPTNALPSQYDGNNSDSGDNSRNIGQPPAYGSQFARYLAENPTEGQPRGAKKNNADHTMLATAAAAAVVATAAGVGYSIMKKRDEEKSKGKHRKQEVGSGSENNKERRRRETRKKDRQSKHRKHRTESETEAVKHKDRVERRGAKRRTERSRDDSPGSEVQVGGMYRHGYSTGGGSAFSILARPPSPGIGSRRIRVRRASSSSSFSSPSSCFNNNNYNMKFVRVYIYDVRYDKLENRCCD